MVKIQFRALASVLCVTFHGFALQTENRIFGFSDHPDSEWAQRDGAVVTHIEQASIIFQ
jgi:hypothetical protein